LLFDYPDFYRVELWRSLTGLKGEKMYSKILVPLDGSKLAECVIPHVELIAKGCGAKKIIFFRVWEPLQVWSGKNTFNGTTLKRLRRKIISRHWLKTPGSTE
jgi:hypothetical protein